MGVGVLLLAAVFLLSTSASGRPSVQLNDCRDLKAAIEGDAAAPAAATAAAAATGGGGRDGGAVADLILHLQSGLPYRCEESIFIAETQSVLLVGSRKEGSSYLDVAPNQDSEGAIAQSLFVNKGTLRLENIGFRLDSRGDTGAESRGGGGGGAAAMAKESAVTSREKDETSGACAGGVRLVRNSGHVAMREITVFDASFDSGWRREQRCQGRAQGRVVFSDQGEPREQSAGGSGRSVVVSDSKFGLGDDGRGTAAFHVNGGKLAVHRSRFDAQASPLERKGSPKTSAGLDESAVAPALAVFDADAVVANTSFAGFGVGAGRGSGAITFKESGGFEGQQRLTVSNCSFLGTSGDLPGGHDTTSTAAHLLTHLDKQDVGFDAAAQFRRLKSCSGLPCLDQGLLLVIISAGLLAILMGMCCLESWLRMHPDGLDRCLPRRFRSTRVHRVQHDQNADKSPPSRTSGVDLGSLEAAGMGAAATKPLALTSVGTGSTSRGAGSIRASSTQLHADQYSVYDGTCDEEVSFVVPQTFKHILAKPQANVRPSGSRGSGFTVDVSLDDDTATTTTTESRSSSNESSVLDAKRPAFLGIGAFMNDAPPFSAAVFSAATGPAGDHDSSHARLDHDRLARQEVGRCTEGMSLSSSAALAVDEQAGDDRRIQLDRDIRDDSLSPDSLQGVETNATPCDSVSTSTDMYESGSLVLVRSPRPEETIQAFASVNSLSAAAIESLPAIQHSDRRLEIAMGNHWQETKAESDGGDSAVAAEETEGRAMSGVRRSWSSPSLRGGGVSPGGYPGSRRDSLWSETGGSAPSTIVDDLGHRISASSSGEATTSMGGGIDPVPGILLKAAPFSPLQSPAESSLSALSIGALSKMLQKTHGGDAIPPVERTHEQVKAPGVATRLPVPSQNDSDMCYSPDSDADHEEIGAGFHSNNPMLKGQWPCEEEKVDISGTPAAAVANRPSEIAAVPTTRLPSLQGPKDGSGESSSPAMSRASDGGFLSTRPSSLSCSSEASASPVRKDAEVPASAPVSSSSSSGESSENSTMFIAAPHPVDRDDDGMCYSSPSTDGSDERREDHDCRMFAVSPAFSTPGRCLMGVSPDGEVGDLLSRLQAVGARDTSTPQLRDGFVQASTAVEEGNASSSHDGVDVQVSGAKNGVPDISPPERPARDLDGAGVRGVVPASHAGLSPVTSSYSLYCSPPSTVGGPSPDGTPDRSLKNRKGGGPLFAATDCHNTTVEASDELSSA